MESWIWFALSTLCALFVQGFFALFEMAAVSCNKMRLQYHVAARYRPAIWLDYLLQKPSRLFGTTLLGVNTALQVGSECARRMYESLHLNPDIAPFSQLFLVIVFAELSPMFAARRHPEKLAFSLSGIVAILSKILTPFLVFFEALSYIVHRMMGMKKETPLFFSREEIKMAFEGKEEGEEAAQAMVGRIFQLKNQTVESLWTPLRDLPMVAFNASQKEVQRAFRSSPFPWLAVFHKSKDHITGILHMRDAMQGGSTPAVKARPPWFILKEANILEILTQFRQNGQTVAIVLEKEGNASGFLTFDHVILSLFGKELSMKPLHPFFVTRTLPGDWLVSRFNREFSSQIPHESGETLSDYLMGQFEHPPTRGETLTLDPFFFTVQELTLTGIKTVLVQSLRE